MSYEKLLNAADTYLQLAQLQYINGVTSYMDVLDAQRGLLDAQLSLNKAMLDELLSTVYLYRGKGAFFVPKISLSLFSLSQSIK